MTFNDMFLAFWIVSISFYDYLPFGQIEIHDNNFNNTELKVFGIVGGVILWVILERLSFIANTRKRMEQLEWRLTSIEIELIKNDRKIAGLLVEQQEILRDIRDKERGK